MKRYRVVVTPEAEHGIQLAFHYIDARSEWNARRWLRGLYDTIDTLERFPERCAYARERAYVGEDLRQIVFKSHRIVFLVDESAGSVFVVAFRHAAQQALGEPGAGEEA